MTFRQPSLRCLILGEVLILCFFQLLYACGVSVLMLAWSVEHQDIDRWYAGRIHGNSTYVESVLQGNEDNGTDHTAVPVHTFGVLLKTYSAVDMDIAPIMGPNERRNHFAPMFPPRTASGFTDTIFRPPCCA